MGNCQRGYNKNNINKLRLYSLVENENDNSAICLRNGQKYEKLYFLIFNDLDSNEKM